MSRFLSECCDAPPWLPDVEPTGNPPVGICNKCREHSEFYDADKADHEHHKESEREIREGR